MVSFLLELPGSETPHGFPPSSSHLMPRKTALALVVALLLLNCGTALHATELALNGALNTAIPALPASAESRPFGLDRSEANASPMIEGFSTANPASATAPVATTSGDWINPGMVPTSRLDARPWSAPTLAVGRETPHGGLEQSGRFQLDDLRRSGRAAAGPGVGLLRAVAPWRPAPRRLPLRAGFPPPRPGADAAARHAGLTFASGCAFRFASGRLCARLRSPTP